MKSDLQEFLEDCGFECRGYSGRYMGGKSCLAIVVDTMAEILDVMYEMGRRNVYVPTNVKWDNMGYGYVFYWPGVEFVGDVENEDGGDEGMGEE